MRWLWMGALSFACVAGDEMPAGDPVRAVEERKDIPVRPDTRIDLLFVVDDSSSMADEQASLAANVRRFATVLENVEGGLPDLHIGVVTTDLGGGGHPIAGCEGDGRDGALVRGDLVDGAFLEDVFDGEAPDRRRHNYDGSLADALASMADVGAEGCELAQPLEAMRRALDDHPANAGFLRDDAFLMVVFLTDEDDCSVRPGGEAHLARGGSVSFRCVEEGIVCEDGPMRQAGEREGCRARGEPSHLERVQPYVDFLKGLTDDPGQVIVATATGPLQPVIVDEVLTGDVAYDLALAPSCDGDAARATPAFRLSSFADAFPQRSTRTSICNEDLSDLLVLIAERLAVVLGNPCIEGALADHDPDVPGIQPECVVSDVHRLGQDGQGETLVPSCDADFQVPCYLWIDDPEQCDTATGLGLLVCRGLEDDPRCPPGGGPRIPPDTTTVVRCRGA